MKRSVGGIVVDADVARASAYQSKSDRAGACARALMVIRSRETLRIAFDARLFQEWNEHRSRHAREWLVSMFARRRVVTHASVPAWVALRTALERLSIRARSAAEKDLHLVELARHDGWRIVSLDGKARRAFIQACSGCVELRRIAWADPTLESTLHWLADGARKTGPRLGDDLPAVQRSRKRRVTRRS